MKIPKFIDEALKRRVNAAIRFIESDCIVSAFIEKNEIEVDTANYGLGYDTLLNPERSAAEVREAILKKEEK